MKKQNLKLTDREKEIMELLWDVGRPLSSSEMIELSPNKSWKTSYIHLLINSLLKKEMIQVAGFVRTAKNYARNFEPTMTKEEYAIELMKQESEDSSKSLSQLFVALVEKETDKELINELSEMLEKRKRELEEEEKNRLDGGV